MTAFESIIYLTTSLVPTLAVLAFLLLNQRQRIEAELTDQRLRHDHCAANQEHEQKRIEVIGQAAQAYAPVLGVALGHLFEKLDKPKSAAELSDDELAAELRRRLFVMDDDEPPIPAPQSAEPRIN